MSQHLLALLWVFTVWGRVSEGGEVLAFRAMFVSYDATNAQGPPAAGMPATGQLAALDAMMRRYRDEGFNVMMWFNTGELSGIDGSHALIRHKQFPEARELTPEANEKKIGELKWLFAQAKRYGMRNFLYFNLLQYTPAFARAHGLDKPLPVSPTVHPFQHGGYGGSAQRTNLGVRTDLTRAYTEAVFREFVETYDDLDGFYGCMGETVPGKRSSFFREAIAPALKSARRHLPIIVHQWQVPLPDYLEDIAPREAYDNTWLGYHAYNSEQITDAQPYPGLVMWARTTGLPTVAALYPANIKHFPFNSPRLAFEITREMKRIPNFQGFMFWNFPGPELAGIFQRALGYYASRGEAYSDAPWIELLAGQFGDRTAGEHFLKAYNISGAIVPETCALVYNGSDFFPRELAMPYEYFNGAWSRPWQTSPARSGLIPVDGYAQYVAQNPEHYKDRDGSDWTRPPYKQEVVWGSEGGSLYDVTPIAHMKKVRRMGEECLREAREGLKSVRKNRDQAQRVTDFMEGYALFARYYERKVAAATSALVYRYGKRPADKADAEKLADEALESYIQAANFYMKRLEGAPELMGRKPEFAARIETEKKERRNLPTLFQWPSGGSAGDRVGAGIYPALDLRSWPGLEKVVGRESIGDPIFGFGPMSREELEKRLPELNPIDNLRPLAEAGVRILLLHGDNDRTVPLEPNSGEAQRRYRTLGGCIEVQTLKGLGHTPGAGFYDSAIVVKMLTE
jgi:alpha-beta hydrolase superfamily lysophospholipase